MCSRSSPSSSSTAGGPCSRRSPRSRPSFYIDNFTDYVYSMGNEEVTFRAAGSVYFVLLAFGVGFQAAFLSIGFLPRRLGRRADVLWSAAETERHHPEGDRATGTERAAPSTIGRAPVRRRPARSIERPTAARATVIIAVASSPIVGRQARRG